MRELLKKILWVLSKLTLARFKPRIVAITGSVGKTSTKDAAALVLKNKFSVRKSFENYNNEIGVPLTIIDEPTGGKNPLLWLWIFLRALGKLIYSNYPQVLVLEVGTDRPGDIAYLVKLLGNIDVAILTDIGISHLEFFGSPAELAKEKTNLIRKLQPNSSAILNFDNPKVFDAKNQTKAKVIGFGFNSNANANISDFQIIEKGDEFGANFKLHFQGNVIPFFLPNVLGKPAVYAATAASMAGYALGVDLATASLSLLKFVSPAGRLRVIEGIKNSKILDDTYNAAPDSAIAAIDALNATAHARKVVAIGSMAELGNKTESGHREVARKIFESKIDLVVLVGENTKVMVEELNVSNFSGKILWFKDSSEVKLKDQIKEKDTVLVKGSQATRMERIVKDLMQNPQDAEALLVRQSDKWLKKP